MDYELIKLEMISKVDEEKLNEMFSVLNSKFQENLILELDKWAENKMKFYLQMGRNLKIEKEVSFSNAAIDMDKFYGIFKKEEKKVLDKFILTLRKISYSDSVEDMIMKNRIDIDDSFTFTNANQEPWLRGVLLNKTSLIKNGMKFSSILSKFCSEDTLNKYSNLIQENQITNGLVALSIDPLDYLTLSLNKHNWESCIKLGGEYSEQGSTIGLMMDNCTLIQYLHNGKEYDYEVRGHKFTHNSKKWRRLIYCNFEEHVFIPARQYPYQIGIDEESTPHPLNVLDFENEVIFHKVEYDDYDSLCFNSTNSYVDDIETSYAVCSSDKSFDFNVGEKIKIEFSEERFGYWDLEMQK